MGRLNIKTKSGKTITDAIWFTNPTLPSWPNGGQGCVGIITLEGDGKFTKFIGMGKGISEEDDAILISDWGSTLEEGFSLTNK